MKNSLLLFFLFCTLNCSAQVYRWDVKILIDSGGLRIYNEKAKHTTIHHLANNTSTPRPANNEMNHGKRADAEKKKVTVTAYIIATGHEDDGDYHLVCEDPSDPTKTLIAEIPDPDYKKLKGFPGLKSNYSKARNEIDTKIGKPTNSVKPLPKKHKVTITGIIFFDKIAHGNGHAENGVEIHPVLAVKVLD